MTRMDVREKLIEILRKPIFPHELVDPTEAVADYLLDSGVTVQEWISVDERLPDATGRYLAVKKRIAPDALGGNRTDIVILRFFEDSGFKMPIHIPNWINEEINDEVTHWMPLPQPPEEDT